MKMASKIIIFCLLLVPFFVWASNDPNSQTIPNDALPSSTVKSLPDHGLHHFEKKTDGQSLTDTIHLANEGHDLHGNTGDEHHGEGGGHHGGIHIFTAEFARVQTPFIISLWIICASLAKIGFHVTPKLPHIFPESCLLILLGVIIGLLLFHTNSVGLSPLTPTVFFFYMLPPIILDAGYFMPNRLFFDHLGTILIFAVIGTIWNTCTIGLSLWGCGLTGIYGFDLPVLDTFLFSALISAVDPVAVLAVFEQIHVNEVLYIVVFGESLLNDAVTVVLYNMFDAYVGMGIENIKYTDVLSGFASFAVVAIGGTLIGIIWGFATGFVTRFTNHVRVIEPLFIFVMSYMSYLNAEIFHMSGILAITFCGITMKNYVEANISPKSSTTIKYTMKMLSSSSETIIFMFLGVNTVNDKHEWNTAFILLTILFCSVYRTIGVMVLTAIANRFRLHKLDRVDEFVMSYGGLRGAVAFALVLLVDPMKVKKQPLFVTATIAVVFFTVFVQGITIKPLVEFLKVKKANKFEKSMHERVQEKIVDYAMSGVEDVVGQMSKRKLRDKFKQFNNKYIRPCLIRDHAGHEPKILETYAKLAMKDAIELVRRKSSTTSPMATDVLPTATIDVQQEQAASSPSTNIKDVQLTDDSWRPDKKGLRRFNYTRHAVDDRELISEEILPPPPPTTRRIGNENPFVVMSAASNWRGLARRRSSTASPTAQEGPSTQQSSSTHIVTVIPEEIARDE